MSGTVQGNNRFAKLLIGFFVVGSAAMVGVLIYDGQNDEESGSASIESVTPEYKELGEDMPEAKLAQDGAKALLDTDVSGYSTDELYAHYLEMAELFVAATEYPEAAQAYSLAGNTKPEEYSVYIAKAEAYLLEKDAEAAKAAYAEALESYKRSGEEDVAAYENYIRDLISGVESAIVLGPFDSRSTEDNPVDQGQGEE